MLKFPKKEEMDIKIINTLSEEDLNIIFGILLDSITQESLKYTVTELGYRIGIKSVSDNHYKIFVDKFNEIVKDNMEKIKDFLVSVLLFCHKILFHKERNDEYSEIFMNTLTKHELFKIIVAEENRMGEKIENIKTRRVTIEKNGKNYQINEIKLEFLHSTYKSVSFELLDFEIKNLIKNLSNLIGEDK